MSNYPFIPSKFSHEILAHIVGIFSSKSNEFPLILGIFGNPGEGKTYMCEHLLLDFHIKRYDFSVSEFEDESSGVPAKKLRAQYDKVVQNYVENQTYGVLMINDIDTAIGNWGDMHQYTVNTQHIVGELMQISDPHYNQSKRIPIIITGNNFSTIYMPLKRSGRIARFYWKPEKKDIIEILSANYVGLSQKEISKLVGTLNTYAEEKLNGTLPVSFFTSLKSKLYKQNIVKLLDQQTSLRKIIALFNNQYQDSKISLENLISVGIEEVNLIAAADEKHMGSEAKRGGHNAH